jgi:FixJ family two-component response regulator
MVLRARIVLAAAQGHANAQVAQELDINVDTVRLWRDRWAGLHGIDLETLRIAERLKMPLSSGDAEDYPRTTLPDGGAGV